MQKSIKKALSRHSRLLGGWIQIGHPSVGEIMGALPFDWIAIDCEHTDIGIEGFTAVLRSIPETTPVFARVKENDVMPIRLALDAGASGVIVPLVSSRVEAEAAVSAAKYPPEGRRGFAFCRANKFGAEFEEYAAGANRETAVVVMIETRRAVENIEEILSVPGVDGVFVGPYDLSGSFGIPGELGAEPVRDACKKVFAASIAHGKSCGLHIVRPSEKALTDAFSDGCNFIAVGMDTVFLVESAKAALVQAGKKILPERK